jgi:NADH:ubiquinone oxidoreductase subunit F (NADH-binding)/NADH:ubiquinone oxidoreductase subunit E
MVSPPTVPQALADEIAGLVAQHHQEPEAVLDVLSALHARHGPLDTAALAAIARALRVPAARVYGVASFYTLLAGPATPERTIHVCDGPACWLRGAEAARAAAQAAAEAAGAGWHVARSSCLGLCDRAPAALVAGRQSGPLGPGWSPAAPDGRPAALIGPPRAGELRVLLARAGRVDPESIDAALALGAYRGLQLMLGQPRETVINLVEDSGLLGRGGAGFPAGRKWRMVAAAPESPHYVVCNADESEPLVFKDRVLIDSDPHLLLEGLALAGYAIAARDGFIYIRGEYPDQADRLERAIQQAEARGWLGERIRDSDFSFHIHVHRGAGAYICGEETALLESLEGRRGEPRLRPPYPTTRGYHGLPTLVNNVETLANVPAIVVNGPEWYRGLSTAETRGTKLYALLGHVQRPGLIEAPFGLSVRRLIDDFGGGLPPGSTFHFALTGGAAGMIVPPDRIDVPLDYASFVQGAALGAGAILVCDQSVSPVALLRELLHFFAAESCGKCTPCRVGTRTAHEILTRLAAGQGRPGDVAELARLTDTLQYASFCGLGQSAALPLRSALTHFAADFAAAEESAGGEPAAGAIRQTESRTEIPAQTEDVA